MEYKKVEEIAASVGYTHMTRLDCSTVKLMKELRDMCASNSCGMYNQRWSCPPGCGELSECEEKVRAYKWGIIVQTVAELEDSMDVETMMDAEAEHKERFIKLTAELRKVCPGMLALGSGCCTLCKTCTYPDKPCRFPEKQVSSMEAFGLLVSQICTDNHIPYYYGPCTIAYTSCYLIE